MNNSYPRDPSEPHVILVPRSRHYFHLPIMAPLTAELWKDTKPWEAPSLAYCTVDQPSNRATAWHVCEHHHVLLVWEG